MSLSTALAAHGMVDVGIIGSGIIGLSIARELAGRGLAVRVLSRKPPRQTTSWAASGIFPPAPAFSAAGPGEQLTTLSDRLHRHWHQELLDETGINNGLATCGGLYLAVHEAGLTRLRAEANDWQTRGAVTEWIEMTALGQVEPALAPAADRGLLSGALLLPEETQIRPPRHLQALEASCRQRGVKFCFDSEVQEVHLADGRIDHLKCSHGREDAGVWILAGGAWSQRFAEAFGSHVRPQPVRGQIMLLSKPAAVLTRVVNVGLEYLVPRPDGRVLVGSTLENVGFTDGTTESALHRMRAFAGRLVPALADAAMETSWSGLRPASPDGLPWIGHSPNVTNGLVATGHFRAGWHQSTGTALIVANLLTDTPSPIDPTAFAVDRLSAGEDFAEATMQRAAADMAAISW